MKVVRQADYRWYYVDINGGVYLNASKGRGDEACFHKMPIGFYMFGNKLVMKII